MKNNRVKVLNKIQSFIILSYSKIQFKLKQLK